MGVHMTIDVAGFIVLSIFVAGAIFQSGRLTARVEGLEQWRAELLDEMREFRRDVARLVGFVKGEDV